MVKKSTDLKQIDCVLGSMGEMEKVFKKFDANGDGKISVSEFKAILKAIGTETSPDELKRTMSKIDTDDDGYIDPKDFMEFHLRGSADGDNSELREAFAKY